MRRAVLIAASLLECAPAASCDDDVAGGSVGPRRGVEQRTFEFGGGNCGFDGGGGGFASGSPGGAVRGSGSHAQVSVGLDPAPGRARRHGQVMRLGAGEPGLDLDVVGSLQKPLPLAAARLDAPAEELASAQARRGCLKETPSIGVEGRDPGTRIRRHAEEAVAGSALPSRIGEVVSAIARQRRSDEGVARIAVDEGVVRRGEHARVRGLLHGDVGPPVDGNLRLVGIPDGDPHQQHRRAVGQPGVDLERHAANPLPLPHPKGRRAVGQNVAGGEKRRARQGPVTGPAKVPFDAPADPGGAQGEVAGLEDGVLGQKLASVALGDERPEPAAEFREEGGAQMLVLEGGHRERPRAALAVEAVLEAHSEAEPRR